MAILMKLYALAPLSNKKKLLKDNEENNETLQMLV